MRTLEGVSSVAKIVQLSSTSSELCSGASKRLQILLMNACLLLVLSLWHFLALWSSDRLNAQVEFADNKHVTCPTVCTTYSLCHSDILSVLPSHYDMVNEMPVFWSEGASMMTCCELVNGRLYW